MTDSESEHDENSSKKLSSTGQFQATSIPRTANLSNLMREEKDDEFKSDEDEFENKSVEGKKSTPTSSMKPQTLNMAILDTLVNQTSNLGNLGKWTPPPIPNNSLIQIMDKAAEIISDDVPGTLVGNQIQILLDKVLLPLMEKVLFDDINLSMDNSRNIISCIYRIVTMFVAKLRHMTLPVDYMSAYWRLFHLVMNQNNRFYLKTSTYATDQVMNIIPGDLQTPSTYLKRDSEFPDWYTTVFLWFIKLRGFTYLTEWATRRIPDEFSIEEHFNYANWLLICGQFKPEFNRTNVLPFMKPLLDKIMNFTEDDINKAPLDFRENNFFRALFNMRLFVAACDFHDSNPNGYCSKLHYVLLKCTIRAITHGNFIARLVAIEEFTRVLAVSPEIGEDEENSFKKYIKEEKLVEILYRDYLHHMAFVERVLRFMSLLFEKNLIDESILDLIWDDQLGKHDAILRNVIFLLSKLIVIFSEKLYVKFFGKLKDCWETGDDKMRDVVLDLVRRVGSELSNQSSRSTSKPIKIVVDLLWSWTSATKNGSTREKLYTILYDILQETVAPTNRNNSDILSQIVIDIAYSCTKATPFIYHPTKAEDDPVALSLHYLKKIMILIPEQKLNEEIGKYVYSLLKETHAQYRQTVIRQLDLTFYNEDDDEGVCFAFGRLIVQNICNWINTISPKVRDSPHNSMDTFSNSSESGDPDDMYLTHLRKRLDFLHYLIVESRKTYAGEFKIFASKWVFELWRQIISVSSNCLQAIGFRFFRDLVSTILDNMQYDKSGTKANLKFFNECVLSVNPTNLSTNGFRCFQQFLKFINLSTGALQPLNELDDEEDYTLQQPDFEGESYLRSVIMYSDDILHKSASCWLEKMYSSYLKYSTHHQPFPNNIIEAKCVTWLEEVDRIRRDEDKSIGDRMIKNTILAILEVVEKTEADSKLVMRQNPCLRRSIASQGFKISIIFKDDVQMIFPHVPPYIEKGLTICVNQNVLLYDLVVYITDVLSGFGGVVTPYPIALVRKSTLNTPGKFGTKLGQQEWGYTMHELGINSPIVLTVRIEKSRIAMDPLSDPLYMTLVSPEVCFQREQRMLSYQLADNLDFITKILDLADENELLDYCFQLLACLPVKHMAKLETTEDFENFLGEIRDQKSLSRRLYYIFVLFKSILPAKLELNRNPKEPRLLIENFYEADGVSILLRLFCRLMKTNEKTMDFEMFCCDILFRLVPTVLHIYLLRNNTIDFNGKSRSLMDKLLSSYSLYEIIRIRMDDYVINMATKINQTTTLKPISFDLDVLLSIVRAGSKFLSNSCGNIFFTAMMEAKSLDDDDVDDEDLAEEQAENMIYNCVSTLSMLALINPNRGKELLESVECHKFLVDCCNMDRLVAPLYCKTKGIYSSSGYEELIPLLFNSLEDMLEVDHLLEGMIEYMFTRLVNGTSTYWKVLRTLILSFNMRHKRPLAKIEKFTEEIIEWLKLAQKESEETLSCYQNQHILLGRLQVAKALIEYYPHDRRTLLMEKGDNLVERLLVVFLMPSSREYYLQKCQETGMVRSLTTTERVNEVDMDFLAFPRSTSCLLTSRAVSVCSTVETQAAAYDLLVALANDDNELSKIINLINEMFYEGKIGFIPWDYQAESTLRSPGNYVGLRNAGATCYMNSILQQLFMLPEVRDPILQAVLPDETLEQPYGYALKILSAVQSIFANLSESELEAYAADELWNIYQLNEQLVNLHEQQDAYEFYNKVVDHVDEAMEKIGYPKVGTTVFGGKFADEKICKDCPHRYTREEPFTSISIDVRSHNNIVDSMKEFVRGDVLENDNAYHCEKCDKKVRAVKRMTIKTLPDILVVQLKRFEFDWERNEPLKFNDYFEFPFSLNMSPYTTDVINARDNHDSETNNHSSSFLEVPEEESNNYSLKGVVVHSGQATGGHYFSYIRNESNNWFKFDDNDVSPYACEPHDIKLKWFGEEPTSDTNRRRPRVWWNAFILFYEKTTPIIHINKCTLSPLIVTPGVPLTIPLTVEANLPMLDYSRRSSTASPVTRLHKRFSNMSLKSRSRFIPPKLEAKVRSMNTRIMHEKNEYSYPFFDFMFNLLGKYLQRIIECYAKNQDEKLLVSMLKLNANFIFHTMIRSAPISRPGSGMHFPKTEMVNRFCHLLHFPAARNWFINNYVLNDEISTNFLKHTTGNTQDRSHYVNILACILELACGGKNQPKLLIEELLETKTIYLTKALEKRCNKSPYIIDLILEPMLFMYGKEYCEEIMCTLIRVRDTLGKRGVSHILMNGGLTVCISFLQSYRCWENMAYINILNISGHMFTCFDFRSLKGTMLTEEICPYLQTDDSFEPIRVEQCIDCKQITEILSDTSCLEKYLEFLIIGLDKSSLKHFQDIISVLCWNNYDLSKRLLAMLVKQLQSITDKQDFLLAMIYTLSNLEDSNNKQSKLFKWFINCFQLNSEHFAGKSANRKIANFATVKNDIIRRRLLMVVVILLEAYSKPKEPEFDGPTVYDIIRETQDNFFIQMAEYCSKSAIVTREIKKAFEDVKAYKKNLPKLPQSSDDAKIRLLLKYREYNDGNDITTSPENSDESEMETDTDSVNADDQPLDLTIGGSARSSVTTPMLAEKRTLLQDDGEGLSSPGEPKKSRYSTSAELDDANLLMFTSTSALDLIQKNKANPPPPYDGPV